MFVSCPECSTKFVVADEAIGEAGRKLRCGSCKHVWHQEPLSEEDKKEVEEVKKEQEENLKQAAEAVAAGEEPSLPAVKPKTPTWLIAASVVLLLANIGAFVTFNLL